MSDGQQKASLEALPKWLRVTAWTVAIVAVLALLVVPLFYGWYVGWTIVQDPVAWNNFGTFVGGTVGPILSTLAIVGLLVTIYLTQRQVGFAREALSATRDQTVNAAFFEMVSLHNQIVAAISFTEKGPGGKPTLYEGRAAIRYMYGTVLKTTYVKEVAENHTTGPKQVGLAEFDRDFANTMNEAFPDDLGHYFRNLYRIMKYVHESALQEKDKRALTGILRAQLSNSELGLLFYNGQSDLGRERFKPLLEQYSMFQNMTVEMCIDQESASNYDMSAYGNAKDKFVKAAAVAGSKKS